MRCANRLVIGRYSVLPMYQELERDLGLLGSVGYYWSMADCADQAKLTPEATALADTLAIIAAKRANLFTLDLAETETGEWILIEINDGQTAVPSENDLDELYGNLREALKTH